MSNDAHNSPLTNESDSPYSRFAFAGGLLFALICLPPWIPVFLSADDLRDPSWMYALHDAFVQGRQFGSDVVFTYGPFGFVTTRMYHPATYTLMSAIWLFLAAVFFTQIWNLTERFSNRPISRLGIAAISIRVAALDATAFFVSFLLIFLLRHLDSNEDKPSKGLIPHSTSAQETPNLNTIGLVVVIGFLPLTKFTFVPMTGLALLAVSFIDIAQRRVPITAMLSLCVTAALWCLAGQSLTGIFDYLRNGMQVSTGYEAAMSLWESAPGDIATVWIAAAVGVMIPWLFRSPAARVHRAKIAVEILVVTALLFISWKAAFVRFHTTKVVGYSALAFLTSAIFLLARRREYDSAQRRYWIGMAMAASLLAASCYRYENGDGETGPTQQLLLPHPQQIAAFLSPVTNPEWRQREHVAVCREIRQRHSLPDLPGTVDVIPHKLAIVLGTANKRYQSRPVWQSYCAFTPELSHRNAQHFRSAAAPRFALFRIDPLDDRFPSLDDGLTWRAILQHYQLYRRNGDGLILQRSLKPRPLRIERRASQVVDWNTNITIPRNQSGLLWCRVQMTRTIAGRLAAIGYKLPTISIHVTTANGSRRFRLIPGMAEAGFLLSPLVQTTEQFADVMAGKSLDDDSLQSVRFSIDGNSPVAFFNEKLALEFEWLESGQ